MADGRGLVLAVLVTAASCVQVGRADLPEIVLSCIATNAAGTSTALFLFSDGVWSDDGVQYCLNSDVQVDLVDPVSGNWIASLLGVNLCITQSTTPAISVSIGVYSGQTQTTFEVDTARVVFRTVPDQSAVGRAVGSVTVSDLDGNFARAQGVGTPGTGMCKSYYNGAYPAAVQFSQLVGSVYASGYATATGSQLDPPFGFRPIGANVSDMSVRLAFRLTPLDVAYATVNLTIPQPSNRCIGDVNVDDVVDVNDLAAVLAAFGASEGQPRYNINADVDNDGNVSVGDLGIVLASFGVPCL